MTEQEKYMKEAIRQAKKAYALGEVPIGCVIVNDVHSVGDSSKSIKNIYGIGRRHSLFADTLFCGAFRCVRTSRFTPACLAAITGYVGFVSLCLLDIL